MSRSVCLAAAAVSALGVPLVSAPCADAGVLRAGGAGPHSLNLLVSTDTLPGTSATRYGVPAADPVVVRYTLVNSSEAGIVDLHVDDPEVPSSAISCAGGGALLAPLSTRRCTATVPAADGRRVRTVTASGTLVWFGTRVSASASTGYVGYQASLTVHELVAGARTGPGKPGALAVGAPVRISYQITNTGDVPLSGLTLHSSLENGACPPEQALAPGGRFVCAMTPRAAAGLHLDAVVASATPQVTVLSGDGGLAAAPPVSARDEGAYLGVSAPAGSIGGGRGGGGAAPTPLGAGGAAAPGSGKPTDAAGAAGAGSAGDGTGTSSGARAAAGGGGSAAVGGTGVARGGSGAGADGGPADGDGGASSSASAGSAPLPLARAGAGAPRLMRHIRRSLPWLTSIFLIVFVPVVLRLARANRSSGR